MPELDENLRDAERHLDRFRSAPTLNWINGVPRAAIAGQVFQNSTPIDNSKLGEIARSQAEDIDLAACSAQQAFMNWRAASGHERRQVLHRIADLIERRAREIALVECLDTGQAIRYMSKAALRGAENFRFFADRAPQANDGLSLPADTHHNYTIRQPIGAVGIITPWNTPFMLSTWKIAPALAAGCTVVHKPAEWSPLTATLLAEIATEAGLPNGVWNLVHGLGEEAGKALTEHPAIKAVGFVGESATGCRIMAQGASTLKRVHFELGGKNPVVVFDDADLDRALDAVIFMLYSLNGERCTSSSRLLVHHNIAADFLARLCDRVRNIRVGHPLDPETEVGPLVHKSHFDKVVGYFDIAKKDGATIAVGGHALPRHGQNYVAPTLFTGVTGKMRVAQEEIFGPVLCAIEFGSEDEAIAVANDVPYGLAAYVWTENVGRAQRMAHALDVGMVWVNSDNVRHLPSPFGGVKASGIGRDGGDYSFDFYMETKNVCVAMGSHKIARLGV